MIFNRKTVCALCLLLLGGALYAQSSAGARGGTAPAWVNDPYSAYNKSRYLAAVGLAGNRNEAEKNALAALTAIFGQSVQTGTSIATMYTEAVSKGIITASENTSIRDTIVTAASLDMLVGAEIGNVWDDGRGKVYAVACLEREKTAATYTEMIRTNQKNIESLTAMSASAKNTFDGYARYKLASLISGLNDKYANVVTQTGGALPASPNLPSTGALDQEASNIIKNISVAVNVKGDRDNRIRDAFSKALNGEGLRTQGSSTPYTLEAALSLSEAEFPNNPNKFCRYTVSANLIEKATGAVLLPFNLADRAGHATYEGAVANAITTLEKNIGQKFPEAFREYLAALLPKK